jgi:hypothetical protein
MVAAAESREQRSNDDREITDPAAGGRKRMRWRPIRQIGDRGDGASKKEGTRATGRGGTGGNIYRWFESESALDLNIY